MESKILKRQTVCWTAKGNKTPFGHEAIFALLLATRVGKSKEEYFNEIPAGY